MQNFTLGAVFRNEFVVSESVYKSFQQCSGDFNPLHTNEAFAQDRGFKGRVMYGNILNAFLSCFIGEKLPAKNVIIHSQEIAYKNPVFMDDVLTLETVVSGSYESVNVVEFKYKFLKSDGLVAAKGKISIGLL